MERIGYLDNRGRITEKYAMKFGTNTRNQNDMHEEIKSRLNSANACHHLVQNPLSCHLLP
jgi:hypothetical protein